MMDEKVEKYYQRQAKDLTNMLFDKSFLADDLSRESIDQLEDCIGFIMQSQCKAAARVAVLVKKFKGANNDT